jgi:hypothetical protein
MAIGKQASTAESLQKDIEYLEWRVPMEQRMAVEYEKARAEHNEGSISAMSYERYAGAEGNAKTFGKELKEKREQLEALLKKQGGQPSATA